METRKSVRTWPGFFPSTTTRSASVTASSMLWVTRKTARVGIFLPSHSSSNSERSVSAVSTSSAENGSSMKSTSGSTTSARANPTRCFMPPERSFGYAISKPSRPTESRMRRARFIRSVRAMPRALSGASTFSITVSHGNSAKLWKTIATFGHGPTTGWPCHSTCPDEGGARPERMRRIVDLPEPEGPSSARISPGYTARSVADSTWIRAVGSP